MNRLDVLTDELVKKLEQAGLISSDLIAFNKVHALVSDALKNAIIQGVHWQDDAV